MAGFLFAFLACLLASLGARDQVLVAQMTARQGQRPALLLIAIASTVACTAVAAWLAGVVSHEVPGMPARTVFAGLAMALAGGEALLLVRRRPPQEPTGSLFAALVVVAALQVTDAVRFLIVGLSLAAAAPQTAAMGGAAAGVMALTAAWLEPELAQHAALPKLRRLAGLLLLVAGLVVAWQGHLLGE